MNKEIGEREGNKNKIKLQKFPTHSVHQVQQDIARSYNLNLKLGCILTV